MTKPRILILAGSLRTGSYNDKLAKLAERAISKAGGEVTRIVLSDYPLPIYDADLEAEKGLPDAAIRLKELFLSHPGIFLASPEYNAGVTPLLKNTIDWVSRRHAEGEPPLAALRNRAFAISAASPGGFGGMRGLLMLRQILAVGTGAVVIPEQVTISNAAKAFDEDGELVEDMRRRQLDNLADSLVLTAARYA